MWVGRQHHVEQSLKVGLPFRKHLDQTRGTIAAGTSWHSVPTCAEYCICDRTTPSTGTGWGLTSCYRAALPKKTWGSWWTSWPWDTACTHDKGGKQCTGLWLQECSQQDDKWLFHSAWHLQSHTESCMSSSAFHKCKRTNWREYRREPLRPLQATETNFSCRLKLRQRLRKLCFFSLKKRRLRENLNTGLQDLKRV